LIMMFIFILITWFLLSFSLAANVSNIAAEMA